MKDQQRELEVSVQTALGHLTDRMNAVLQALEIALMRVIVMCDQMMRATLKSAAEMVNMNWWTRIDGKSPRCQDKGRKTENDVVLSLRRLLFTYGHAVTQSDRAITFIKAWPSSWLSEAFYTKCSRRLAKKTYKFASNSSLCGLISIFSCGLAVLETRVQRIHIVV